MSTDWDRMISEHYEAGRKDKLSPAFLLRSVREVLLEISDKPVLKPIVEQQGADRSRKLTIELIPSLNIRLGIPANPRGRRQGGSNRSRARVGSIS